MIQGTGQADPNPPSLNRLSQLWQRIYDHKIAQWSLAYIAVAYGVQHGVVLTSEAFEWPHAFSRVSMLLLALGLPLVMTVAWYHGERASRQVSRAEMAIISILLVIGSLFFYVFVQPSAEVNAGTAAAVQQVSVVAARSAALNPGNAISVAVLPFANLSDDKQQDYFSDGMTDEISGALAKIPDLRVVGRASAFQFKGQNKDLRAIGRALSATHLIEGSVRKAGNRVRISAELVQAGSGLKVWSENYDRELTDVFAIQEDIAQAIAISLRMPLGLKQGEYLVPNRSIDPETYDLYLRAKALLRMRGAREPGGPLTDAATLLEGVVGRNPNYAPAWALLSQDYGLVAAFGSVYFSGSDEELQRIVDAWLPKAEAAAQEVVRLDGNSSAAYATLASVQFFRGQLRSAEDLYKQALKFDPDNADVLHLYSLLLGSVGHLKDAVALRQRLQRVEPFVPVFNAFTADFLWLDRQDDAALAMLRPLPAENPFIARQFSLLYATDRNYREAAVALLKASRTYDPKITEMASRLLLAAPAGSASRQSLPPLGFFGLLYVFSRVPDRALDFFEASLKARFWDAADAPQFWHPSFAALRKTERFKDLMRTAGLVDYWRERGWPDLCHPVGPDDFACD